MDDQISQKFENRGIKITRVYSILITKSINIQFFTLILYGLGGPLWSKAISVHSQFIEKSKVGQKTVNYHDAVLFASWINSDFTTIFLDIYG